MLEGAALVIASLNTTAPEWVTKSVFSVTSAPATRPLLRGCEELGYSASPE